MTDKIEALERLARLKAAGALSEQEFLAQKAAVLAGTGIAAKPATSFGERWREARQETRGVRRFSRWFWGIQLVIIVLLGVYSLTRGQALHEARDAAAIEPTTDVPGKAGSVTAGTAANADFILTDHSVATARPTWESVNNAAQITQFCAGTKATLSNGTSKTLHLDGGMWESDTSWTVGTVMPEATLRFEVGDEPGKFFVGSLDDGHPLVAYEVVKCDANGTPQ